MKPAFKSLVSVLLLLAGIFPLWACGQSFSVTVTSHGATATGTVTIEGAVQTFTAQVGPNGTVTWDIQGCRGSVSGLQPGSPCTIICKDPLLAEWPTAWTFVSGTWTDLVGGSSGTILVTPASGYRLEAIHGPITVDPGYSTHVMRLSAANLGPTTLRLELTFNTGGVAGCLKGLDVAIVQPITGLPFIVPLEGLPLNFTALSSPDYHVYCLAAQQTSTPAMDRYGLTALVLLMALVTVWVINRRARRSAD
jgi:hypothetical protein